MADEMIKVYGLSELSRALKRLDAELPKHMRVRLKGIAERVAAIVRERVPSVSGNLARNIKARATRTRASVASTADYAAVNEFGGWPKPGPGGSGYPFVKAGRYVFPAVEAQRSRIEDELIAALNETISEAGLG